MSAECIPSDVRTILIRALFDGAADRLMCQPEAQKLGSELVYGFAQEAEDKLDDWSSNL